MTAEQIQEAVAKSSGLPFSTDLDSYFLAKPLTEIYAAGEQAEVPLLCGSNSEEQGARGVLGTSEPTPENFANAVRKLYGDRAGEVLKAYAPTTPEEVIEAATELASARFIAYGTWKWAELQAKTGGQPVYRYLYAHPRPKFLPAAGRGGEAPPPRGAVHSAEIQYAMGNLPLDPRYAWEPADYKVSGVMQAFFANFITTGNPNGPGSPNWPAYTSDTHYQIMRLDSDSHAEPEPHLDRYLALDAVYAKP
jgi:para-nitrobenzyl esterase